MAKRIFARVTPLFLTSAILSIVVTPATTVDGDEKPAEIRLAAAFQLPQLPGLTGPSADWRQWDSFFTFIVKRLGQDVSGELRSSLGEAFLDSRYELTHTWSRLGSGQNPVPQLFVNAWRRQSPIMNKAVAGLPKQTAGQYANFIGAADKLTAVGHQGSQLGVLQIVPMFSETWRGFSNRRGAVIPIAYNLNIDGALRNLVGLGLPTGAQSAPGRRSGLRGLPFPLNVEQASLGIAFAAEANVKKLNQWVPEETELQAYLLEVRSMLTALGDRVMVKSELAERHKALCRQIVLTAAWQESCWRQFIKKGKTLVPWLRPAETWV
jgi:hypothetical protein